jgi:hypothetical protein
LASRQQLQEYVHDRKGSLMEAQGHMKDTLLYDHISIRNMELCLHQTRVKGQTLANKTVQFDKQTFKNTKIVSKKK